MNVYAYVCCVGWRGTSLADFSWQSMRSCHTAPPVPCMLCAHAALFVLVLRVCRTACRRQHMQLTSHNTRNSILLYHTRRHDALQWWDCQQNGCIVARVLVVCVLWCCMQHMAVVRWCVLSLRLRLRLRLPSPCPSRSSRCLVVLVIMRPPNWVSPFTHRTRLHHTTSHRITSYH